MANEESHSAICFKTVYSSTVYPPITVALCMIALTFPVKPCKDTISMYQMWILHCIQVLPIVKKLPQQIAALLPPHFSTRREIFAFVCELHRCVVGEELNQRDLVQFLSRLRANECRETKTGAEQACVRTNVSSEHKTCAVIMFANRDEEQMDKTALLGVVNEHVLLPVPSGDLLVEWETEAAFCSCYFSVKWYLLHLVASGFPVKPTTHDRFVYHTFVTLFGKILACSACRVNYQTNLDLTRYDADSALQTTESFVAFMHALHDSVNNMLHKKPNAVALEETVLFFETLKELTSKHAYKARVYIANEKDAIARFYIQPAIPLEVAYS